MDDKNKYLAEELYRQLTGHHSPRCHCDECLPKRLEEVRRSVEDGTKPTELERLFILIGDTIIIIAGFGVIVLAILDVLSIMWAIGIGCILLAGMYWNHRELR